MEEENLGVEFIRKVEAFFCEVCRAYLPRLMNEEKALRVHCRSKNHLRCYLRFGSEELLEKIQNKEIDKPYNENEDKSTDDKDKSSEVKGSENHDESVEEGDNIDWGTVENIMEEIPAGAGGKSDDEDEEEGDVF